MKKIILTLALMAFAFGANAQFVIGGNIGFSHDADYDDNYTALYGSQANTDITILPKVGYQLNDDMQVGAQLGWNYNYTRMYAGADDSYTSRPRNSIMISPYFRYNLLKWKKFNVFCEAAINFELGLESKTHTFVNGSEVTGSPVKNGDNFTSFGIGVVPGLNYAFSKNFSMDIYINLASIYWNATSYDGHADHAWGFGANMSEQTLNAHLNNFLIGFNYHL